MDYNYAGGISSNSLLNSNAASTAGLQQALFHLQDIQKAMLTESQVPYFATGYFRGQGECNEILERNIRGNDAGNATIFFQWETTPLTTYEGRFREATGNGGPWMLDITPKHLDLIKTCTVPLAEFKEEFRILLNTETQQYTLSSNPLLMDALRNSMSTLPHDLTKKLTEYITNKFYGCAHAVLSTEFLAVTGGAKIALPYMSRISDTFITKWAPPADYPEELYRDFDIRTFKKIISNIQEVIKTEMENDLDKVAIVGNPELFDNGGTTVKEFLMDSNEKWLEEYSKKASTPQFGLCRYKKADRGLEDRSYFFKFQTSANMNAWDKNEYLIPSVNLVTGNQTSGHLGGKLGWSILNIQPVPFAGMEKYMYVDIGAGDATFPFSTRNNLLAVGDVFYIDTENVEYIFSSHSTSTPVSRRVPLIIHEFSTDPRYVPKANDQRSNFKNRGFNYKFKDATWLLRPVDSNDAFFTSKGLTPSNPAGKFIFRVIVNNPFIVGERIFGPNGEIVEFAPEGKRTIALNSVFATSDAHVTGLGDGWLTVDATTDTTGAYAEDLNLPTWKSPKKMEALRIAILGKNTGGSCKLIPLVNNRTPVVGWRGDMVGRFPVRFGGLKMIAGANEVLNGGGRFSELFSSRERADLDLVMGDMYVKPYGTTAHEAITTWQFSLGVANNNTNVCVASIAPVNYIHGSSVINTRESTETADNLKARMAKTAN